MTVLIVRAENGRIHKMFSPGEDYPLASFEGCNLDDTAVEFLNEIPEAADDLCGRCFPQEVSDDPRP